MKKKDTPRRVLIQRSSQRFMFLPASTMERSAVSSLACNERSFRKASFNSLYRCIAATYSFFRLVIDKAGLQHEKDFPLVILLGQLENPVVFTRWFGFGISVVSVRLRYHTLSPLFDPEPTHGFSKFVNFSSGKYFTSSPNTPDIGTTGTDGRTVQRDEGEVETGVEHHGIAPVGTYVVHAVAPLFRAVLGS